MRIYLHAMQYVLCFNRITIIHRAACMCIYTAIFPLRNSCQMQTPKEATKMENIIFACKKIQIFAKKNKEIIWCMLLWHLNSASMWGRSNTDCVFLHSVTSDPNIIQPIRCRVLCVVSMRKSWDSTICWIDFPCCSSLARTHSHAIKAWRLDENKWEKHTSLWILENNFHRWHWIFSGSFVYSQFQSCLLLSFHITEHIQICM